MPSDQKHLKLVREETDRLNPFSPGGQYDYRNNAVYLVSLKAATEELQMGDAYSGVMVLNDTGRLAHKSLLSTAGLRPGIRFDQLAVLPSAVHFILVMTDCPRLTDCETQSRCRGRSALCRAPVPGKLGKPATRAIRTLVDHFKLLTARGISASTGRLIEPRSPWQIDHFEKPLRNDADLDRARRFIHRAQSRAGRGLDEGTFQPAE